MYLLADVFPECLLLLLDGGDMHISVALAGSSIVGDFKGCKGPASSGKGQANLAKGLYLTCPACEGDIKV